MDFLRRRDSARRPRGLLAGLLLLLAALPAAAERPCEDELREAQQAYDAGRVQEVFAVREACLRAGTTKEQRIAARALLAKAYVAVDDLEEARRLIDELLALDPLFKPAESDPVRYVRLFEKTQAEGGPRVRVAGASKFAEPLREVPATVAVVTADDIARRGYRDLEELLHDLPGFDISRGNGDVYSNVYQRGYRSDRSDRMLFLVDGVEQNDLHSNTADISRQYPLANVERVEVVYGPASTIYGANAFTGVVSVTTRRPAAYLAEGKSFGGGITAAAGTYDSRYADVSLAGRSPSERVAWTLAGRVFRSDEQDLSGFADWDSAHLASLDGVDYGAALRLEGEQAREVAAVFTGVCTGAVPVCEVVRDSGGQVVAIEATPAGLAAARRLDQELFDLLRGRSLGFSDPTDDWSLNGTLQISDLTLGIQMWRRQEGSAPWYTDLTRPGSLAGNVWTPRQFALSAKYSREVGNNLLLTLFSRYQEHELDGDSSLARFATYSAGFLDIVDLGISTAPHFEVYSLDQVSTQLRNELTLIYEPSESLILATGVELRSSSIQADFASSVVDVVCEEDVFGTCDLTCEDGEAFCGEQFSAFFFVLPRREVVTSTDLGIFAQAYYKPHKNLKVVVGGRLDDENVRANQLISSRSEERFFDFTEAKGTGSVFNPRLALVYSPGSFVAKAVYSEAFKQPSSFQKYTSEPGVREFANPDLEPERVRNFEVSGSWQDGDRAAVEVAAYQADYSDVVAAKTEICEFCIPSRTGRFRNSGRLRVRGLQAQANLKHKGLDFFGNYTYTDPKNLDPTDEFGAPLSVDELRVGDIARHRLNLGVHAPLRDDLDLNVRFNYVGSRQTGEGTTVPTNPFPEVGAYVAAHASLRYTGLFSGSTLFGSTLSGSTLQLVINNLFDEDYDHPGVSRAGRGFAARLPQPGRTFSLRLSYEW